MKYYKKGKIVTAYPAKIEGTVLIVPEKGIKAPVKTMHLGKKEGYVICHKNWFEWVEKQEFEKQYSMCIECTIV